MFSGVWCGQMGVGGWVLMGLFWATFVGLVVWAVSRLFAPASVEGDLDLGAEDLDLPRARGQFDLTEYRTLRKEPITTGRH